MSKTALAGAVVIVAALGALLAGVVIAATAVGWTFGGATASGITDLTNVFSVFVAVAFALVLVGLCAVYLDDRLAGREISPLYLPVLVLFAVLSVVVWYIAAGALASLRFDRSTGPHFVWRFEPEVRLGISLLYLGVGAAAWWLLCVVIYRRGMPRWGVLGVTVALIVVAALGVLAVTRL